MKTIVLTALVLAVVLFVGGDTASSHGLSTEISSLSGLQRCRVVILDFNGDAVKDGLNKDELQRDVELLLRQSGIIVVNKDDTSECWAYLYVRINMIKEDRSPFRNSELYAYMYNIDVYLFQWVGLKRNTAIDTWATTWDSSLLGSVYATNMPTTINKSVIDKVEYFINDYLAANPKK